MSKPIGCRTGLLSRGAAALAGALLALSAPDAARAASVSFGDSVHAWAGYTNGTSDDARDTIGTPDLLGGIAEVSGGLLTRVTIEYLGPFSLRTSGRGSVVPGDLFIDAGGDGQWDFVLKLVSGPQTAIANDASAAILDVAGEPASYLRSGYDDTHHWRGFAIRDQHPYAWAGGGTQIGTGSLTAPSLLAGGPQSLVFELGAGVAVGEEWVLGFAASCGNDVLFERIAAAPVPEPTAALVFAAGLLLATRRPRRA
jgi:hypothetical protein